MRERDTGTQALLEQGALLNSVRVYIPIASLDKDQETRLYKFTRKQGAIEGTRPKGDPYQKRVINSYFSPFGKTNEGNACIPQPQERFTSPLNS